MVRVMKSVCESLKSDSKNESSSESSDNENSLRASETKEFDSDIVVDAEDELCPICKTKLARVSGDDSPCVCENNHKINCI
jgi:hypothetical protein